MATNVTAEQISTAIDPKRLAAYRDMFDLVDSHESLLALTVCAITEQVCANARRAGVERPNAEAVMAAAIDRVLSDWRDNQPRLWFGYLRETGLADLAEQQG